VHATHRRQAGHQIFPDQARWDTLSKAAAVLVCRANQTRTGKASRGGNNHLLRRNMQFCIAIYAYYKIYKK
jgi:hypothetical protein